MAKFSKKQTNTRKLRAYLLPLVVFSFILVSLLLVVKPKVAEIFSSLEAIKQDKEKLSRLTQKLDFLRSLDQAELKNRSQLVLKTLPVEKEPLLVIMLLDKMAREQEVEITGLGVKPGFLFLQENGTGKKSEISTLEMPFKIQGEFEKIKAFFQQAENVLPLLGLKNLYFREISSDFDFTGTYDVSGKVVAYHAFLPKKISRIDAPLSRISKKEDEVYKTLTDYVGYEQILAQDWQGDAFDSLEEFTPKEDPFL